MEVKKEKTQAKKTVKRENHFVWLGSYIIVACICITSYFLIRFNVISVGDKYHNAIEKISLAGFLSVLILTAAKFAEIIIIKKAHTKYKRYNLVRLSHLISLIAVSIVIISFLFANW